jgi:hypothetical protein
LKYLMETLTDAESVVKSDIGRSDWSTLAWGWRMRRTFIGCLTSLDHIILCASVLVSKRIPTARRQRLSKTS